MVDTTGLSLDQAPPIHLPLRFFLTAPWFAVAAGLILAVQGDVALASRWTPAALALTHLLTIGFLGQVMCGALLQMLPVIAGAPVPGVRAVATGTHLLLTLGSALLAWGFLGGGGLALGAGALAAGLGFSLFLAAMTVALIRARGVPATLLALRLAALALAMTVLLGLVLTAALLGWLPLPRLPDWVQAHLSWGLLGWTGLLIVGVGYQVVPLFHVTPPYPALMTRTLAPALFLVLAGATLLAWAGPGAWATWAATAAYAALALGFAAFAVVTLVLQTRRTRPRLDATLLHWRIAMGALLAAAGAWWLQAPSGLLGVLLLVGVGVGLPSGMLLKIVPFLCWFHLQSRQIATRRFTVRVPHMHRLLPDGLARWHPPLHGLALGLLVAGVWIPVLARLGGLLLAVAALWLFVLIAAAAWRYRRVSMELN